MRIAFITIIWASVASVITAHALRREDQYGQTLFDRTFSRFIVQASEPFQKPPFELKPGEVFYTSTHSAFGTGQMRYNDALNEALRAYGKGYEVTVNKIRANGQVVYPAAIRFESTKRP